MLGAAKHLYLLAAPGYSTSSWKQFMLARLMLNSRVGLTKKAKKLVAKRNSAQA